MYEWSSNHKNLLLITGHTHHPVFASGKYSNHSSNKIDTGNTAHIKPSYFNSGCCCYSDGDITGIEIEGGHIRLVKWHAANNNSSRMVLEAVSFEELVKELLISN
jgi:hypothetical protein